MAAAMLSLSCAYPAVAGEGMRDVLSERLLVIDTNKGRILVEMNPEIAPRHVERIRQLAGEGFYDNGVWHRVIDGFMAQGGDPTGTGEGGSAYGDLPGEMMFRRGADSDFVTVATPQGLNIGLMGTVPVISQGDRYLGRAGDGKVSAWGVYCRGTAGMARDEAEDSANSQFFLMRDAYPSLDKRYTVWGQVIAGLEVVRDLKTGALPSGMVSEPDQMVRIRANDQLPVAEQVHARVSDTRSPQFQHRLQQIRAQRGADFSVCDVTLAVEVSPAA